MNKISDQIKSGAIAFLTTEYKYLACFVVVVFAALVLLYSLDPPSDDHTDGIRYGGCFLAGALLSGSAGWGGMLVATDANVRTTQAADVEGLAVALRVAFTGGAVMGFTVVGLGLMGVSIMFYLVTLGYDGSSLEQRLVFASDSLAGFGFGASSIALFARVAGGIFTKAADVGADLVGKVEMDIPEDDPRNPAVIADNVGDNVGDVAGMGADLFESFVSMFGFSIWMTVVCFHLCAVLIIAYLLTLYLVLNVSHFQVGSIIAAVTLANGDIALVMYPFWIAGAGIIAAMFGYFAVSAKDGATQQQLMFALHKGTIVSSILVIGFGAVITPFVFSDRTDYGWRVFSCICIGLAAGIMIGQATEFFTSYAFWPTQSITDAGVTGPATVIIQGLGIGMISTVFPVIIIVATILGCNALAGEYGIAMSAVGMLSTLYVLLVSISTISLSLLAK
jgi:K(+)-stimulated pyrophosphate-energized sodium pump